MGLLLILVNYNNSKALTMEVYGASQFEVRLHFKVDEFLIMCYLLNSFGWRFAPLKSTLLIVLSYYYPFVSYFKLFVVLYNLSIGFHLKRITVQTEGRVKMIFCGCRCCQEDLSCI